MMSQVIQSGTKKEVGARSTSGWRPSFAFLLLMIVAAAAFLYFSYAVSWTKFSRAEIFFAECAREMVATNNLITPLYQGKPFFDKPILVYWLIVCMYKAFGISRLVARIPSIVAALATVVLTAVVTRHAAEKKRDAAGLVAAMCLSSAFMFFSFAYLCMSDMYLVLFDSITLVLAYLGFVKERRRNRYWLGAAITMGFGFITKGPVGVVLPGAAALLFAAATKRLPAIKWYHLLFGALIVASIAVPWFYAAYKANGSWALAYFFIRENFQRYAGSTYDTRKPVWFMLVSLMTGFLPWSCFLPPALLEAVKGWRQSLSAPANQQRLFLWIWVGVVTAFFSLSRGKCDYYVLPVYPAAAALVAMHITSKCNDVSRLLSLLVAGLFLVAGIASPMLLGAVASNSGMSNWWLMPAGLIIFGALGLAAAASERLTAFSAAIFCAICIGGAGFAYQMLPVVGESQPFEIYAGAMKNTPPYTKVAVHKSLGHWVDELTFEVERNPVEISDTKSVEELFRSGPAIALIPESAFEKALAESAILRDQPLRVLDRRMVAAHPLTPGYVVGRRGNLYDTTLVLVAN